MSQNNYNMQIVASLLKTQSHIRQLARDLKTNKTTIARKIQELYQENIVDFKKEGKNKAFFIKKTIEAKQYAYLVEANKLIETIKNYPVLRNCLENIKKNEKVQLAILFGSYAKNLATKESDIDIYIDTNQHTLKEEIENLYTKINVKIGKYNKDSLLIKEIEKNHVIIKGIERFYEKNKFFN